MKGTMKLKTLCIEDAPEVLLLGDDLYEAKPVVITQPCLLIRIHKPRLHGMSAEALYEATRGVWHLGERRNEARYALAVYRGVVRQAYEIQAWHNVGTTPFSTWVREDFDALGQWEFTGFISAELARKYNCGLVEKYLRTNARNSVVYVNC